MAIAITHFNDLPQTEQTLATNLLGAMEQSIEMNRKVPRVWKKDAYEYVAERIRNLALNRCFRNQQKVVPIDYSQFYGTVFRVVETFTVRNVHIKVGNRQGVFQQVYKRLTVIQDGEG
jgi:hypothetical protein